RTEPAVDDLAEHGIEDRNDRLRAVQIAPEPTRDLVHGGVLARRRRHAARFLAPDLALDPERDPGALPLLPVALARVAHRERRHTEALDETARLAVAEHLAEQHRLLLLGPERLQAEAG